jgi:DNA ligase 1
MRIKRPVSRRAFMRAGAAFGALLAQQSWSGSQTFAPPRLMLANVYHTEVDISDYWVSEKYDGVRAFWNGASLVTRSGKTINAPDWFGASFPHTSLDGELWIGRGSFEELVATVRDQRPDEAAWRAVRYMTFDLPRHAGPYSARLASLRAIATASESSEFVVAPQWQVASHEELASQLHELVGAGAEGLMLKRESALYHGARNDDLLKVKPYFDAEARVVAHIPGQGKHLGRLGALEVVSPSGTAFRIGTGFSDEQRAAPPPIGSWITYRYQGTTKNGIPRFASFLRMRE